MNYDLNQFAAALKRLLELPGDHFRQGFEGGETKCNFYGGCHGVYWPPGTFAGTIGNLLKNLSLDDQFLAVVNRPHEVSELRSALKQFSHELHQRFGIIVTLDRNRVELSFVKKGK